MKSGRCCKLKRLSMMWLKSLNPFEVREVLQAVKALQYSRTHLSIPLKSGKCCKKRMFGDKDGDALNPFEVREVLQVWLHNQRVHQILSIPLKSGKCCKEQSRKDGREIFSQSLWSQGSAARWCGIASNLKRTLNPFEVREVLQVARARNTGAEKLSIPLKSGKCCKVSRPRTQDRSLSLNPFEVREVLQVKPLIERSLLSLSIPLKSGKCCKRIAYSVSGW